MDLLCPAGERWLSQNVEEMLGRLEDMATVVWPNV